MSKSKKNMEVCERKIEEGEKKILIIPIATRY